MIAIFGGKVGPATANCNAKGKRKRQQKERARRIELAYKNL